MKKNKILLTIAGLAVGSFLNAQSLSIYAEYGEILDASGATVDAITGSFDGYFGFVDGTTDLSIGLSDPISINLDWLSTVGSISWTPLVTFNPGSGGWFLSPNGAAFDPLLDITTSNSDLALGQKPVILFTDAASVGEIGTGSQLIVAEGDTFNTTLDNRSSYVSAGAFNAVAGANGSLQAGTVVPEPAHFAAIFGALGLAFAIWRRRR
ncbi:MAG: PEP-CTERM sorting domain-containing protein [Opitutales bacterium]